MNDIEDLGPEIGTAAGYCCLRIRDAAASHVSWDFSVPSKNGRFGKLTR
jgi:hypothetical protein